MASSQWKNKRFLKSSEKNWQIDTFKCKDLPFLHEQGIISQAQPAPSNDYIQEKHDAPSKHDLPYVHEHIYAK